MKHTLKSRAIVLAAVLATGAGLAGCSKDTPPEDPSYSTETTVYATAQNKVVEAEAVYYAPYVMPGFTISAPVWYQIGVTLTDQKEEMNNRWVKNDTLYIKRIFEPGKIVDIDVILLTNYDAEHLKGASIADQFDIETTGHSRMGLTEYFQTYGSLDWRDGQVCLLIAKTLPTLGYNESEFFDLPRPTTSGHRGFGAILRLTLEDNSVIETKPFLNFVYYEPETSPKTTE